MLPERDECRILWCQKCQKRRRFIKIYASDGSGPIGHVWVCGYHSPIAMWWRERGKNTWYQRHPAQPPLPLP